ncbi:MAG: hypothetical protein QOF78_3530 [Phycisphaerales bacterium]|jgi:REP element-mobilizing transposase RayT|nr:hypothetical protein [Phycisphaerales bacterium]
MSDDATALAFHITFGTYGTRLHGDERGTVDRRMNAPGEPIIGRCDEWERMERHRLNFEPRVFTIEQMSLVESLVPAVCKRGGWTLHTCAAGPDHVHNILTPLDPARGRDSNAIRRWLKTWLGQSLAKHIVLQEGETFWAECGSVKWIWTNDYFFRALKYVSDQRATERNLRT